MRIGFDDIRRGAIDHFNEGKIINGGIPCGEMKFYQTVEAQIEKEGLAHITREIKVGRITRYDTFITDQVIGVRGGVFFFYKGEEVYYYSGADKNVKIYYDEKQQEYSFEIFKYKNTFNREQCNEMIEVMMRENYNDLLRCFGTKDQVEKFATDMDMDFKTRKLFDICVHEKLQEQYVERYGVRNPLLDEEIDLIQNYDEVYYGKTGKKKWLVDESYAEVMGDED